MISKKYLAPVSFTHKGVSSIHYLKERVYKQELMLEFQRRKEVHKIHCGLYPKPNEHNGRLSMASIDFGSDP